MMCIFIVCGIKSKWNDIIRNVSISVYICLYKYIDIYKYIYIYIYIYINI